MSEPHSWRRPRPAPQLSEIQTRLPPSLIPGRLRSWWPALLWAVVIFIMSTDTFSSEHTAMVIEPLLRWMFSWLHPDQFDLIHHYIRKSAHFTEYFLFGVFLYRGVRGRHQGWRWSWGLTALGIAAGYSILDEIHQSFVASRTASPYDSLLDSIGAFVAIAVLWLWFRWRRTKISATAA